MWFSCTCLKPRNNMNPHGWMRNIHTWNKVFHMSPLNITKKRLLTIISKFSNSFRGGMLNPEKGKCINGCSWPFFKHWHRCWYEFGPPHIPESLRLVILQAIHQCSGFFATPWPLDILIPPEVFGVARFTSMFWGHEIPFFRCDWMYWVKYFPGFREKVSADDVGKSRWFCSLPPPKLNEWFKTTERCFERRAFMAWSPQIRWCFFCWQNLKLWGFSAKKCCKKSARNLRNCWLRFFF